MNLKLLNKKWKRYREYDQESRKHKHHSHSVALSQEPTESVVSSQTAVSDNSTVSYPFEHQSEKRPHSSYPLCCIKHTKEKVTTLIRNVPRTR